MENVLGFVSGFAWMWIIIFVIVIVSVIAVVRKRKKKSIGIGLVDVGSDSKETLTKNEKPLKILKERLAKGEITKEEYDELKKEF